MRTTEDAGDDEALVQGAQVEGEILERAMQDRVGGAVEGEENEPALALVGLGHPPRRAAKESRAAARDALDVVDRNGDVGRRVGPIEVRDEYSRGGRETPSHRRANGQRIGASAKPCERLVRVLDPVVRPAGDREPVRHRVDDPLEELRIERCFMPA